MAAKEDLYCNRYIVLDSELGLPDDADLDGGEICHAKGVIGVGAPAVLPGVGSTIEGGLSFIFVTSNDAVELCYDKENTDWIILTSHIQQTA